MADQTSSPLVVSRSSACSSAKSDRARTLFSRELSFCSDIASMAFLMTRGQIERFGGGDGITNRYL